MSEIGRRTLRALERHRNPDHPLVHEARERLRAVLRSERPSVSSRAAREAALADFDAAVAEVNRYRYTEPEETDETK